MSADVATARMPVHDDVAAGFSFPLNVYARLLQWQEGELQYLHYGMFETADQGIAPAQERASRLLADALPPPCRLLDVGIGLGTTLARLRERGYAAHGITPDAAQVAVARQRHGADLPVSISRLEDFDQDAGEWDTLLFQESAQYVAPLALFAAADRLLHAQRGTIVIMDEFALVRRSPAHGGLHHLGNFCALAARLGWRLAHQTDLSRDARPTLDYMLTTVAAQRGRLVAELAVTETQLDELNASNRHYKQLYEQGVYGYALLRFERDRVGADQLLPIGPAQAPAMRALFAEVFKHPMTPEQWSWKYGDGRGHGVGLVRDGRLVAHYGGVSRRIHHFGQPALACQVCDVMVDKGACDALVRRGPMHKVGATFLETQIGWGQAHLLGFGFPNQRAFGVAERLGLYEGVDSVIGLRWSAAGPMPSGVHCEPLGVQKSALTARQCKTIDRLWATMADHLSDRILGVRDADWLRHRYLAHPGIDYEVLLVRRRWTRQALGLLVLRRQALHLDLLDVVGAPENFAALVAVARARAAECELAYVDCWITQSQRALFESIDAQALSVTDLNIRVPANVHTAGPAADTVRGHWFLMAGDADFT